MACLGVSTVKSMDEIEQGVIVFSAHGVPPSFHEQAKRRGLEVLDTTCRFVYDIHKESQAALATDPEVVLVLVIGGKHSANTRHLHDICARHRPSHLIQGAGDIDPAWFDGVECVGITAGASTPDYVIDEVDARLQELRPSAAAEGGSLPQ
jgi:4-hydroxy-3-methylbut-2-enyl diphosphate reductase IspH